MNLWKSRGAWKESPTPVSRAVLVVALLFIVFAAYGAGLVRADAALGVAVP